MKVFISQASRDAAHNLDDLSERWQMRKEVQGYAVYVPKSLPSFKTFEEAQFYKAELATIRYGVQNDLLVYKDNFQKRKEVLNALKHVQDLQMRLKVRITELFTVQKSMDTEHQAMSYLLKNKLLLLHENDGEFVLVFPTVQQTVVIPKRTA